MLLEKIHLEDDEKILRIIRKHWFVITTEIIGLVLLALIPLVLDIVFINLPPDALSRFSDLSGVQPYFIFGSALWVLILTMVGAGAWTHHYLDLWVVTSKRVVLIDQRGFFRRFVSSFRLERLQDMNIEINGVIPTLLNFGTIEAQTAGGSNEEFISYNMPDPAGIKALIIEAADELNDHPSTINEQLREQGL